MLVGHRQFGGFEDENFEVLKSGIDIYEVLRRVIDICEAVRWGMFPKSLGHSEREVQIFNHGNHELLSAISHNCLGTEAVCVLTSD